MSFRSRGLNHFDDNCIQVTGPNATSCKSVFYSCKISSSSFFHSVNRLQEPFRLNKTLVCCSSQRLMIHPGIKSVDSFSITIGAKGIFSSYYYWRNVEMKWTGRTGQVPMSHWSLHYSGQSTCSGVVGFKLVEHKQKRCFPNVDSRMVPHHPLSKKV